MKIYRDGSVSFFYLGKYKNIARVMGKIPYYKNIAVHHFFHQLYYRKGAEYTPLTYEFNYMDTDSIVWSRAKFIWYCYPLMYSISHTLEQTGKEYFDNTDHAFRDPRWRVMLLSKHRKQVKPLMSKRYIIPLKTYQSMKIKWES